MLWIALCFQPIVMFMYFALWSQCVLRHEGHHDATRPRRRTEDLRQVRWWWGLSTGPTTAWCASALRRPRVLWRASRYEARNGAWPDVSQEYAYTISKRIGEWIKGWYPTYTSKDVDFNVDQVIVTCFKLTVILQIAWNSIWPKQAIVNTLLVQAVSVSVYITEP